jgi:CHAT domain-containing protein/Flp pilus assembly protein TadD
MTTFEELNTPDMKHLIFLTLTLLSTIGWTQDYEKANQLFEAGQYEAAIQEYKKVIPWLEKELGKTDTASLPIYNYLLGASYYNNFQDKEALKTLQGVVDFCKKHCDYINPYAIYSHDMMASIYSEKGDLPKLIEHRQAIVDLQLQKEYKKPGLVHVALAYNDLGVAYYSANEDQKAVDAYLKSLEYFEACSDEYVESEAIIHVNVALSSIYLGLFDQADKYYNKGFESIYKIHPDSYPDYITTFQDEGQLLLNSSENEKAKKAFQIDIETKTRVISDRDTSLLESYIFLGQTEHQLGFDDAAAASFDKAIPVIEANFKHSESDLSFWYNYMGGMYDLIGAYQKALDYYELSIPYYESIKTNSPYGYLITVTSIVRAANLLGDYEKAVKYARIKLDYYDTHYTKNDQDTYEGYMNSVYDLAAVYQSNLQMNEAEEVLLNAYKKDKNLDQNPDLHVNFQDMLFAIYSSTGQHEKGHELIDKELLFISKNYGKDDLYYITMVGKGLLYSQKGEHLKAIDLFNEIYPHFEGRKDHNEANTLNNLGLSYIELGNFAKAEKKYFEALSIHQSIDTNTQYYIAALGNLGKLYFDQSLFDKSFNYYGRSKAIAEVVLGKTSQEYVSITNSIANVLLYSQQYEAAFEYYQESLKYMELVFSKDHPMVLDLLGNAGHSLCTVDMMEDGITILEKVHKKSSETLGASSYKTLLFKTNLAMAYHSSGNPSAAKKEMLELLESIDQNINYNLKYMNESASLALLKKMNLFYSSIHSYLFDQRNDPEIVEVCFNSTLNSKGKLLESNTALKNQVANSKNTRLIETYEQWIQKVQTLTNLQNGGGTIDLKLLDKTQEEAEELEKTLMNLSSDFANKLNKKYDWKEVQAQLNDNELIVEFLRFEHQTKFIHDSVIYGAFILDKDMKHPAFISICGEATLIQLLGNVAANDLSYVESIYGKGDKASKLHDLLISPLTPYLNEKEKVFISPDGILHKIAFAAISDNSDYFGNQHKVVMINSGSSLLDETNASIESLSPLLIGDINYDNEKTSDQIWKYLAGTKTEINGISELLTQENVESKLLTGTTATEAMFNESLPTINVIHIATHGFFYPEPSLAQQITLQETENVEEISFRGGTSGAGYSYYVNNTDPMMRSGIALSGANQVWNNSDIPLEADGVLTALDFSLMDLQDIELIVLSACETGLGDIKGSEGVYGLQRSLKLAGAEHIVMSLWQVPDKETKEFMITFYGELLKSNNVEEAFVNTQRKLSALYAPYFWGAFILL